MARKLRIAVSVFFGVLTVALCVLWVRSYGSGGFLYWNLWKYRSILAGVSDGRAIFYTDTFTIGKKRLQALSRDRGMRTFRWEPLPKFARRTNFGFQVVIPGWCTVLASSAAAAAPWFSYRFSLRTLLVATTLVAVVLGLAVWAGR